MKKYHVVLYLHTNLMKKLGSSNSLLKFLNKIFELGRFDKFDNDFNNYFLQYHNGAVFELSKL